MGDGYQEVQEVISIHAPTRGATSLKATEYKLSIDFNPRSHERSDNYIPDEFKSYIISIHAPTRGATVFRRAERNSCRISIHAPTRGATSVRAFISIWIIAFQSTLPREERHCAGLLVHGCYAYFNPRSHERSDHAEWCTSFHSAISIHAPTRGATQSINSAKRYSPISIHAPTRGATN